MESQVRNTIYGQPERDQFYITKNMAFASGALAEGTAAGTIKTTVAIPFMINGKFYGKAITDNIALIATGVQGVGKRCRYLLTLDASGNVALIAGSQVVNLSTGALATLSVDPVTKRVLDSANGLAGFQVGDTISISGFTNAENNGIFNVDVNDKAGGFLQLREGGGMIAVAAGDAVTILRESILPSLPYMKTPIGILRITCGTVTFTPGTDDLTDQVVTAGTGTFDFTNLGVMPGGNGP